MSFILSVFMLVFCFSGISLIHKLYGKTGVIALVPLMSLIANIQVIKMIDFLGITCALGNVVYSSSFLITDILSEFYGKKEADKSIKLGILSFFFSTILIQLSLFFEPSQIDTAQPHLQAIFGFLPRIFIGSVIAYAVSQLLDIKIYEYLKNKQTPLWVRNNIATMIAQFVDTCLATFIMFTGVLSLKQMIELIISAYLIKWLIAMLDTPFLYLNKQIFNERKKNEKNISTSYNSNN